MERGTDEMRVDRLLHEALRQASRREYNDTDRLINDIDFWAQRNREFYNYETIKIVAIFAEALVGARSYRPDIAYKKMKHFAKFALAEKVD